MTSTRRSKGGLLLLLAAWLVPLFFALPLHVAAQQDSGAPDIKFEIGSGQKSGLPEQPLPPSEGPFGTPLRAEDFQERARITSSDTIRTENDVTYAEGRARVEYNEFTIEADRMVIDMVSGEIQAEGNVVYTGPNDLIHASSGRFNLVNGEGVGYGVDGQSGVVYFRAVWDESKQGPAFRQISERESVFRGTHFTTCDFPVPMYYISSTEVILLKNRRIYFRNPVLWVRGVPVFWLPFYTRNLAEGSPWSQEFGFQSKLGFFFRLGYRYIHKVETPDWEDPTIYSTRSHGQLDATLDLLSIRGVGVGATYRYQFDYGRHRGFVQLYGIRDRERDVESGETGNSSEDNDNKDNGDESQRWIYRHKHNSKLTDHLYLQMDIDQFSDPDIYYDIPDRFVAGDQFRRGRLYERRIRGALSYNEDNWIARALVDRKERLGRDRYTDFSVPFDDDLEFDPEEGLDDDEDFKDNGISRDRFGTVSENVSARFATRLLNLGSSPLYYRFEANAFSALDAGFNRLSEDDDARVKGIDVYGALTHRFRFGERTTWTNTLGIGAAAYDRESVDLVTEEDFARGSIKPAGVITDESEKAFFFEDDGITPKPESELYPRTTKVDGLRFKDRNTIVLGDSDTERSPDDADRMYLFADYTSRLNHRFTDFLEGFLRYRIRQGTGFNLGEYYESTGRKEAPGDIHDFYTNRHFVDAGLFFYLRYPNLFTVLTAGQNLQSGSDIYPNEVIRYIGMSTTYINPSGEFRAEAGAGVQRRQLYDSSDPRTFDQSSLGTSLKLSYFPRHARHWASLTVRGDTKLDEDPTDRPDRDKRRFDEEDTKITIEPTIGRAFGPKYRLQVGGSYDTRISDWDRIGLTIIRDLHDADLGLFFGIKNNTFEARQNDREDNADERSTAYDKEIRIALRFKIARDQPGLGNRSLTTLADLRQNAQFVE